MEKAEKNRWFHGAIFGGRRGKAATESLFLQRMIFDMANMVNMVVAVISLDATKCYDRIHANLTTVCLARLGVPINIGIAIVRTLGTMIHRVATKSGISADAIGENRLKRWSGYCQGSAAAGPAWLDNQCVILDCVGPHLSSVTFQCPEKEIKYTNKIVGYVDDVNLSIGCNDWTGDQKFNTNIETTINKWATFLKLTGGDLATKKCTISSNNINTIKTMQGTQDFTMSGECEPMKYLGVLMTPSGPSEKEIEKRTSEAITVASAIIKARLSKYEALIYYNKIWLPKVRYYTGISFLDRNTCATVESPVIQAILPAIGLNRNSAREHIHGYKKWGGFGLQPMYLIQGCEKLKIILKNLRSQKEPSSILKIALRHLQLEAGTEKACLSDQYEALRYTKNTWLTQAWKFLKDSKTEIHHHEHLGLEAQRERDSFIMAELAKTATDRELEECNEVRKWLKS